MPDDNRIRGQKFDLILNVEGRSHLGTRRFSVRRYNNEVSNLSKDLARAAEKLLKSGGLFVCADYGEMADMAKMAEELEGSGLVRIVIMTEIVNKIRKW